MNSDFLGCLYFKVESFVIYGGERFDFVLKAIAETITSYWIRVNGLVRCFYPNKMYQLAILRYKGAPIQEPTERDDYATGDRNGLVTRSNTFVLL